MDIQDQIDKLNEEVKCTLRPSKIHGVGVFALRDIKKGEKLFTSPDEYRYFREFPYEELDNLRPEIREIIIERWPNIINGFPFESPNNINLICFMNHSDEPNSKLDIAIKDIKEGEEVTEDYNIVKNAKKIYKFL